VLIKEVEDILSGLLIASFKTLSIPEEEMDDSIDSDNRDEKESRIEFHIFCLLEYYHWHRVEHSCSKKGKIDETFSLSIKEAFECDSENDNGENTSDLIKKECERSRVKHKSNPSENLPSGHAHPLEYGSIIGHNLRIIHIDPEIIPSNWHRSDDIDETYTDEICEDEEENFGRDEWEIDLFKKSTMGLMGREFDPIRPEIFEGYEHLMVGEKTHNSKYSENTPDIIESKYSKYNERRYECNETKSEWEEESKCRLFLADTWNEPTKCHFPEAIGYKDGCKREEEISENLKKQDETTIRTPDEPKIDETKDHDMEERVEPNREGRKRSFWFFRHRRDIFIDAIHDEYCDDIWHISDSRFVMKRDVVVLHEDKNRKEDKSKKLDKIWCHRWWMVNK